MGTQNQDFIPENFRDQRKYHYSDYPKVMLALDYAI